MRIWVGFSKSHLLLSGDLTRDRTIGQIEPALRSNRLLDPVIPKPESLNSTLYDQVLKNNPKLEKLYAETANKTFKFCLITAEIPSTFPKSFELKVSPDRTRQRTFTRARILGFWVRFFLPKWCRAGTGEVRWERGWVKGGHRELGRGKGGGGGSRGGTGNVGGPLPSEPSEKTTPVQCDNLASALVANLQEPSSCSLLESGGGVKRWYWASGRRGGGS